MKRTLRTPGLRRAATATLALVGAALLAASPPPTTLTDECGGGLIPRADICSVVIAPDVEVDEFDDEYLLGVGFDLRLDANAADRLPTDIAEITWALNGCVWALRWFHDHGTDAPMDVTTRLERECDGSLAGIELASPNTDGGTLSSYVSLEDFQMLDESVALGSVLRNVGANTYSGIGVQTEVYGYSQASYKHDDTDRIDVPLR